MLQLPVQLVQLMQGRCTEGSTLVRQQHNTLSMHACVRACHPASVSTRHGHTDDVLTHTHRQWWSNLQVSQVVAVLPKGPAGPHTQVTEHRPLSQLPKYKKTHSKLPQNACCWQQLQEELTAGTDRPTVLSHRHAREQPQPPSLNRLANPYLSGHASIGTQHAMCRVHTKHHST